MCTCDPSKNHYELKDSGDREIHKTGAARDTRSGKGRYDLISPLALKRLAIVMEKGCIKYSERNWEQGFKFGRCLDSAIRHIEQFLLRQEDEDHLAHAAFNLFAVLHFMETGRKELDDRPTYKQEDSIATCIHKCSDPLK